jgi:predicted DNA-binding transcriptional regulator AlpA
MTEFITVKQIVDLTGASRSQIMTKLSEPGAPKVARVIGRTFYWYKDDFLEWYEDNPFQIGARGDNGGNTRTNALDNQLARQFFTTGKIL